jgi:GH15 family glucan-1,4-alpha-glucosidase
VLLLPDIGVLEAHDPRFVRTVEAIEHELLRDNHVMRYASEDDFGLPKTVFLVCRFWLIDVLWDLGRRDEARDMFNDALKYRNHYGLLAEEVHPLTDELWGNVPRTYTMAVLSRSWEDRSWRD